MGLHHQQSVTQPVIAVALRLVSGGWNESVHAGGSDLLQKQQRRGRAVCLIVELGTEHDLLQKQQRRGRAVCLIVELGTEHDLLQKQQRRGRAVCFIVELGTEHDLLQKQQRRGRAICLIVELGKEHNVPPAPHRPARQLLVQMRSVERRRRVTESPDQREARVQHMRARQQERIASETPEETAARLQDLTTRQQERIASETPEETAARRQRDREAHSHRPPPVSAQPLLHQPAVQARMRKFHSQLASLEVSTCTTCLERFPGMTTRHTAAGTECIRCHRDTQSQSLLQGEHHAPWTCTSGVSGECLLF